MIFFFAHSQNLLRFIQGFYYYFLFHTFFFTINSLFIFFPLWHLQAIRSPDENGINYRPKFQFNKIYKCMNNCVLFFLEYQLRRSAFIISPLLKDSFHHGGLLFSNCYFVDESLLDYYSRNVCLWERKLKQSNCTGFLHLFHLSNYHLFVAA